MGICNIIFLGDKSVPPPFPSLNEYRLLASASKKSSRNILANVQGEVCRKSVNLKKCFNG